MISISYKKHDMKANFIPDKGLKYLIFSSFYTGQNYCYNQLILLIFFLQERGWRGNGIRLRMKPIRLRECSDIGLIAYVAKDCIFFIFFFVGRQFC